MRDVAILGRDHIKVDSLDKVLGRAKFAADYYMPDMLYGGVFRSTVPHAYIKKLNLEKARALPGVATVAAAIAAETLGLEFENIHVTWADTQIAPEGGATSASRQTFITGNAVKNACTNAMGELKRTASEFLNVPQEELIFRHREIYSSKDESKKMTYPELMGAMGKNGRLAGGAASLPSNKEPRTSLFGQSAAARNHTQVNAQRMLQSTLN